jgi:hypothetical protein
VKVTGDEDWLSALAVTRAVPTVVPTVPVAVATPLAFVVALVVVLPLKAITPEAVDVKATDTPGRGLPLGSVTPAVKVSVDLPLLVNIAVDSLSPI